MSNTLSMEIAKNYEYSSSIVNIINQKNILIQRQIKLNNINLNFNKQLNDTKEKSERSSCAIDEFAKKMGNLISKAELGKKAIHGMISILNNAETENKQRTFFQSLLNNENVGSQVYDYISEYSKTSSLGRVGASNSMASFLNLTHDINQIEELLRLTERLNSKNPQKGAEGASLSLVSALKGDTSVLQNDYGIVGLNDNNSLKGNMSSSIAQIDSAMNNSGATQSLADNNFNSFSTQLGLFKDTLQFTIAEQAQPILENLSLALQQLNSDLASGKFEPYINLVVKGMEMIGNGIIWVADNATWLIPVIGGIVTAIVAYNIATAVAAVVTMGLTGNWGGIAFMAIAVTGAVVGMSAAMSDVEKKSAGVSSNLSDAKSKAGLGLATTPLPTEITNKSPISVTGEVDIEKENIKYLMDMAGQKFFAQYSHNTLVPQQQMTVNVTKTADADEVINMVASGLRDSVETSPQGDYK